MREREAHMMNDRDEVREAEDRQRDEGSILLIATTAS